MTLTIRGSLVDASLLEGVWAAPLLGAHRPGGHTRPLSPAWRALVGAGGGKAAPSAGRDGAVAAREIDQGGGGAAHGAGGGGAASVWRPRPTRGESNQRIRFLWAKGIWVILCPALVLKMDDWNRFVKEN